MNQTADAKINDLASALPPRYRWLKRLAAGLGLFFAFVIVLRLWWGHEADRRLQAEIDRIQAAGEPIFPEDFNPTEVLPDDQNAALALQKAMDKLNTTAEFDQITRDNVALSQLTLEEWQTLAGSIDANAESLDLIRQSSLKSGFDWGIRMPSPIVNMQLPHLARLRELARILRYAGAWQHRNGNDEEAVRLISEIFSLAETAEEPPTLISHFVTVASSSLSASAIEYVAWDLAVSGPPAATRDQVRALVAKLLDEGSLQGGLRRAMRAERAIQLDYVLGIVEARHTYPGLSALGGGFAPWIRVLDYSIKPLFELDGVHMLKEMNEVLRAIEEPNWPAANAIIGSLDGQSARPLSGPRFIKRAISSIMVPSLTRAVAWHYRALAERRMAAIALAIRLYELDHGRRPRQLSELVPDYLPAVPLDPMADDGRVISYLPEAKPPILYSVGENGVDDGGTFEFDSKGRIDASRADLLFFLDGVRPQKDNP